LNCEKKQEPGISTITGVDDGVEFYAANSDVFFGLPYSLRRVSSQQIASTDWVHRNIAEGYCRRSIKEYIQLKESNIAYTCV
jgi:hypothetical protein